MNEPRLPRIHKIPILALLAIVSFIAVQSFAASQTIGTLQPGFGQALADVRSAEMAGATPGDISGLLSLLNKAIELNHEALQPTKSPTEQAALITQVNQLLATVQSNATNLTSVYREKTYTDKIIDYSIGAALAFFATILYGFASIFYQTYRIKRTFQMRVRRK